MQSPFPIVHHPISPGDPSAFRASFDRTVQQAQSLGNSLPPSFLVLFSSFVIQIGMALSKTLFDSLGSAGAAFICKGIAALLLLLIWRPRLSQHRWQDYGVVALFGLCIACMNLSIFAAVERVPLGVASTLEFVGPLGVAIAGSRRWLDVVWVVLAGIGVFLLAPIHGDTSLDPLGIGFALISGLCWAGYILLSAPAGRAMPGGSGLALAISFATLIMAPLGIQQAGAALLNPWILGIAFLGGCLTTVLPYSLEFIALKRMSTRVFGVLMSIEPAIAAIVGLLFLHEALGVRSLIAILLVTLAAIGATLFGRSTPTH
ncbi:MAG: EamA family transporter [Oculatellaceae cyanobacterium Prado106]|nr:EamA family transporter [Oculatellaceae cyanobacterium Prado106]